MRVRDRSRGGQELKSSRLGRRWSFLVLLSVLLLVAAPASGSKHAAQRSMAVQQLHATYNGPSALVAALNGGDARARGLARVDLDADGAPDVVAGYAWDGAGIVTVQRGNPDAFAPKDQSVFRRIQRRFDPDWLVAAAQALRVPEPVSYVQAG